MAHFLENYCNKFPIRVESLRPLILNHQTDLWVDGEAAPEHKGYESDGGANQQDEILDRLKGNFY